MTRVPGDPTSASRAQKTMTGTVQCPECGVVLNIPDSAAGRKLKCPKCATKFAAPQSFRPGDSVIAEASPGSTMFPTRKGPISQISSDLPTREPSSGSIDLPLPFAGLGSSGDFDLPTSSGPLGDTFELPLLGDDIPLLPLDSPPGSSGPKKLRPTPWRYSRRSRSGTGSSPEPRPGRRPDAARAVAAWSRSECRLCNTCGLDLDTGQRITPLDVFEDEMPTITRSEMPPLGILFVGSLAILANVLLTVISLVAWAKSGDLGALCLLIVWIFGTYGAVQFLRRKAIRPLFLGLALAVGSASFT